MPVNTTPTLGIEELLELIRNPAATQPNKPDISGWILSSSLPGLSALVDTPPAPPLSEFYGEGIADPGLISPADPRLSDIPAGTFPRYGSSGPGPAAYFSGEDEESSLLDILLPLIGNVTDSPVADPSKTTTGLPFIEPTGTPAAMPIEAPSPAAVAVEAPFIAETPFFIPAAPAPVKTAPAVQPPPEEEKDQWVKTAEHLNEMYGWNMSANDARRWAVGGGR